MSSAMELRKAMQKRLDAFEVDMLKRGFVLKSNSLYDATTDSISAEKLLAYDDAKMFLYVSEHYAMKPSSLALRPEYRGGIYANHTSDQFQSWEDVKRAIPKMMVCSLQDARFLLMYDGKSDEMLQYIESGKLAFDPEVILHLIRNGSYFTKIYSVNFSLHEYQYEKDVLKTMMVRDYCERCVNEKSK